MKQDRMDLAPGTIYTDDSGSRWMVIAPVSETVAPKNRRYYTNADRPGPFYRMSASRQVTVLQLPDGSKPEPQRRQGDRRQLGNRRSIQPTTQGKYHKRDRRSSMGRRKGIRSERRAEYHPRDYPKADIL